MFFTYYPFTIATVKLSYLDMDFLFCIAQAELSHLNLPSVGSVQFTFAKSVCVPSAPPLPCRAAGSGHPPSVPGGVWRNGFSPLRKWQKPAAVGSLV